MRQHPPATGSTSAPCGGLGVQAEPRKQCKIGEAFGIGRNSHAKIGHCYDKAVPPSDFPTAASRPRPVEDGGMDRCADHANSTPLLLHGAFQHGFRPTGRVLWRKRGFVFYFNSFSCKFNNFLLFHQWLPPVSSTAFTCRLNNFFLLFLIEHLLCYQSVKYDISIQVILWPFCDGSAPYFLQFLVRWQSARIHAESLQLVTQGASHPMDQPPPPDEPIGATWAYRQTILGGTSRPKRRTFSKGFLRLVGPHNALLPPPIVQGENRGRRATAVPLVAT